MNKFQSLHQTKLVIALPPQDGSYEYPRLNVFGFKDQYDPSGVTGCAIGIPGARGCAFPGGGSLSLPEFTGYKLQTREFRFYVPSGTKSVMFSGYAPQRAIAAFALRFGSEPARTAPLEAIEYQNAQDGEKIDSAFPKLYTTKQEMFVVHDGGGTLRFLAGNLVEPSKEGGWVYVRQLMGDPLYDIQIGIDLDVALYADAYSKIQWGDDGDPIGSSLVIPPPVVKNNETTCKVQVMSQGNEPFRIRVGLEQSQADIAANPLITIWLAGFVNNTFFFRTQKDTWTSDMSNPDAAARVLYGNNQAYIEFETSIEFTEEQLRREGASILVAYRTNSEPFKNLGVIWS